MALRTVGWMLVTRVFLDAGAWHGAMAATAVLLNLLAEFNERGR